MRKVIVVILTLIVFANCQTNKVEDQHPKFVMFTKPGCPRCAKSLEILEQRGIAFEEKSIAEPQFQREMWELIREDKEKQTSRVTLPVVYMDSVLYYNLQDLDGFFDGI